MTADPAPPAPTLSTAAAPGPLRRLWEDARVIGAGLLVATLVHAVAFQPFTIPSSSMEPGLVTGDYIVVSKFAYGWSRASLPFNPPLPEGRLLGRTARRGDVVVFRLPRDPDQTWIKRVIGLPGDRVQVRGGTVVVNGEAIAATPRGEVEDHDLPGRRVREVREHLPDGRAWTTYDAGPDGAGDDTGVFVVPAGQYFMMGDNRDNSLDSRWPAELGVGLLPEGNILGRAEVVVASWNPGAGLFKPWTWLNLRPGRTLVPIR
jgi:signal peptidase I